MTRRKALVDVRIYSIAGVNAVKNATAALNDAIGDYQAVTATGGIGGSVPGDALAHARRRRRPSSRSCPGVDNDYTASTTAHGAVDRRATRRSA